MTRLRLASQKQVSQDERKHSVGLNLLQSAGRPVQLCIICWQSESKHTFMIWCGSDKDDYLNDTEIINGIDNTITIERKNKRIWRTGINTIRSIHIVEHEVRQPKLKY